MDGSKSWRSRAALLGLAWAALASGAGADLLKAVYEDDFERLQAIEEWGNVDVPNRYGVRPLAVACENGNEDIIRLLIAKGADPGIAGTGGETPLIIAARTGLPAPVGLLLDAGADVNARTGGGQTALMWAAAEGHAAVVKRLLDAGAERDVKLKSGYNAWFFAAREGRGDVAKILLESGVDVNSAMQTKATGWGKSPPGGTSALLLATNSGHLGLALQLLEAGADPNDQRSGYSALHVLTWVRKPKRGDNIDGAPPPAISGSVTSLAFVDHLIEHGAEVNLRLARGPSGGNRLGCPGATPFLFASRTADLPLMRRLLKHGADFRLPNEQGRTPLLAAAGVALGPEMDEASDEPSAIAAVNFLLELGADIDTVDRGGETVMHSAAYKQAPKLVRLLAGRGADIAVWNRKNKRGWTPLLIAQGFRNGNYKPSAPTIAALEEVMLANGVTPPPAPPPPGTKKREKYGS